MNYNSKRLINPLKPICRCKAQEFNTIVDIVRGTTSTRDHNKNIAFRKAVEELTSPCIDKQRLTLAEIVMSKSYTRGVAENIYSDVFDTKGDAKPKGFFILVGDDNSIKSIESIYFNSNYVRNSSVDGTYNQRIKNMRFPLTDKDIAIIKEALTFSGGGSDYTDTPGFTNNSHSGTIYVYKLNGTD